MIPDPTRKHNTPRNTRPPTSPKRQAREQLEAACRDACLLFCAIAYDRSVTWEEWARAWSHAEAAKSALTGLPPREPHKAAYRSRFFQDGPLRCGTWDAAKPVGDKARGRGRPRKDSTPRKDPSAVNTKSAGRVTRDGKMKVAA